MSAETHAPSVFTTRTAGDDNVLVCASRSDLELSAHALSALAHKAFTDGLLGVFEQFLNLAIDNLEMADPTDPLLPRWRAALSY